VKKDAITLENVHTFSVPLSAHPLKWVFEDEHKTLSPEFEDQIIPLTAEASKFLWEFENTQKYLGHISENKKYFKEQESFKLGKNENQKLKKWLYERGIPFDKKVFWIRQPDSGFVLTWKMLIKFSEKIFFCCDEIIWDKTLNCCLIYEHNDVFCFQKNRIYNAEKHSEEIKEIKKIINTKNR